MKYIWSPWRMKYISSTKKNEHCIFCEALSVEDDTESLIVHRGENAFVILNRYPYTSGHLMVVPMAHQPNLENLSAETRAEMMELANHSIRVLQKVYKPDGFNLGANIGEAAGAGIASHVHLHVLPRWLGDTNFMSSVSSTRVLPEKLVDTLKKVKDAWQSKL